ncbi:MAG: hypothetical protein QOC81_4345 [Thermoanaerobaculia bacterium]|nr:hypothetical protein [Thermoanaerobaculia bacterium]
MRWLHYHYLSPEKPHPRQNRYVITWHATEELEEDGLGLLNATNIVLTGTIVSVQREEDSQERKYVIQGQCIDGEESCVVVKLGGTGKIVFVSAWRGTQHSHL